MKKVGGITSYKGRLESDSNIIFAVQCNLKSSNSKDTFSLPGQMQATPLCSRQIPRGFLS
jgi:hypothetical protein